MFLFFVSSQLGLCKQDPCVADILTKKRVLITGISMSFQCNSCDNPYTEIYLYFLLGGGGGCKVTVLFHAKLWLQPELVA